MRCLLCQQSFIQSLTLADIFYFRALTTSPICLNCQRKFLRIRPNLACSGCGRLQTQQGLCQDCLTWQKNYPQLLHNRALFSYNAAMQDFFKQYKTSGDYQLSTCFTSVLGQFFKKVSADIYVPVPTDTRSYQKRGFNPVCGIFGAVVPLYDCLNKRELPVKQAHKNRGERLAMAQPFQANMDKCRPLARKQIILLDDVYTTGRTLFHARDCLLKAVPGLKITTVTLAR